MKNRIQQSLKNIHADQALIESTAAYLHNKLEKKRHRQKPKAMLPKLAGTFAAMMVLVAGFFSYGLHFTADAYISIDVNPSVELTLNRYDKIIAAAAFNEDGERILNQTNLRGKSYAAATGLIMSMLEADGYFTDEILVSVTVQTASSDREQRLCSRMQQLIDEQVLSAGSRAEVDVFAVSAEVWSNAHSCDMSPARYLAIQELLQIDQTASLEQYSHSSIEQIRQRTQLCRSEHSTEGAQQSGGQDNNSHHQNDRPRSGRGHGRH